MKLGSVALGAGTGTGLALLLLHFTLGRGVASLPVPTEAVDQPLGSGVPSEPPHTEVPAEQRHRPSLRIRSGRTSEHAGKPGLTASVEDVPLTGEVSPTHNLSLESEAPSPKTLHPELYVGALSRETVIYEEPHLKSRRLGYARTGALLRRANAPSGFDGCKEGFYLVEPAGYVCAGRTATLDLEHPVLKIASAQPDRSRPLPYAYGRSRYPTPPLYTKIPTPEEQRAIEPDLAHHLRAKTGDAWAAFSTAPPPSLLRDGARIPRPFGYPVLANEAVTGHALSNSAFSFIDLFEVGGRRFGLTTDLSLLPLDRLSVVEGSDFGGLTLERDEQLPVAFTRSEKQLVYRAQEPEGAMAVVRRALYRESFRLSGATRRVGRDLFFETKDGEFLRDDPRLVRVLPPTDLPKFAVNDQSWIDISIDKQTLVAYRGSKPVFVTLVSTGRDGTKDPATTHSTVQGVFRVHTKHVSATMSGNSADDEFDLRDVPFVQYFQDGYALHAAFWHDGFGTPRSHGCVNLSPRDARYLFSWTEPNVPMRWHSALSLQGTRLYIHP